MARFRSAESQAKHAIRQKQAFGKPSHSKRGGDGKIHSLGTARTYANSLKCVATFIKVHRLNPTGRGLDGLTCEIAQNYLESRSQQVGQKQLDKDRQAMQMLLDQKLAVTKSELDQALQSRAYTIPQIQLVAQAQSRKHALATLIAADAGLRAHELLTLLPSNERATSAHRTWTDERFTGRGDIVRYAVVGKGGLIREVAISGELAEQLESLRLEAPRRVTDRDIYYQQHYDLGGGKQWTDSFSKAANRALGWSTGAHGVRHTYAQARMKVLQASGMYYEIALGVVSQEMGHFRSDITEVYLR